MNEDNFLAKAGSTDIIPVSRAEATALRAQAERKVHQPAQQHGITDLVQMGFSRIADRPQVVAGAETDWIVLPADLDPLYQQGKLPAPDAVRARVAALLNAGIQFDALAVAHEVPAGAFARVRTGAALQELLLPPTPRSLSVLATITGCLFAAAWSVGHFLSGRMVFSDESLSSLAPSSDPMLFGAVVADPPARVGDAALYFLIAQWDY
jgi:hypothetical protein